ncbi:MAG: hypothetical protein U0570_11195 [Phycisphaerales bacterium]
MDAIELQPASQHPEWLSGAHDAIGRFFEHVTPMTPWVVALGLGIAFLLWAKGSKLVRPALTLTGAALGAIAGGALATPLASTAVGLLGGALVGGLVGYLSFRVVTAGVAGVALSALTLAGSVVYLDRHEHAIPVEAKAPLSMNEEAVLKDASDLWQRTLKGEIRPSEAKAESQSMFEDGAATILTDGVKARYESLPEKSKLFVSASAAVGAMAGILIGLVFPRGVAAFSTAGLGAAGLLIGGLTLGIILQSHAATQAAGEPLRLFGPWAFLTLVGVWFQRPRSEKKTVVAQPAPQPAPCAPAAS